MTNPPTIQADELNHNPGKNCRLLSAADTLDKIAGSMLRGCAAKSSRPGEEISESLAAETWFDAAEALEAGLATRLAEPVRIAASFDIGRFRNAPPELVEAVEAVDSERPATDAEIVEDDAGVAAAVTYPVPPTDADGAHNAAVADGTSSPAADRACSDPRQKQDVIRASEIQSVRDFGSENATQQVQTEVAYRLRKLRQDAEATFEYHLLNGIHGLVKDPKDHATVVDYFTEFGINPAVEIDFDLDNASPASGALRKLCQALIEDVEGAVGGLAAGAVQVRAECGSAFFADLVAHKEVRETYLKTAAAADLRGRVADEVSFGGITFRRYRGGVGFGVPTDKAYFYPEGIHGLFEIYYAPPTRSRR